MNLIGNNDRNYRQLGRLAELKAYNDNKKRAFGRDITNLDKKIKKNVSIYEKVPLAKVQPKPRSKSLYGSKEIFPNNDKSKGKDAIEEYKQDIIDFMASLQKKQEKDIQKGISEKMRMILIDWLIDVHDSFELKEQTLHLALSYLSDYASLKQISKEEYQLAGITSLWIASKYEEIYPPRTKNYVGVTADTYSLTDLKNMQGKIIEALSFNLNRTTSLQLLESISDSLPDKTVNMCKYLIELALFEGTARKYAPYTLVMGALSVAESAFKIKANIKLEPSIKVPRDDMLSCFKDLCVLVQSPNKYDLSALKRKFGKSRYQQVSKLKLSLSE